MTRHVFVDETKARGYVMAAVAVTDLAATRTVVRDLVRSGNRRLHMHNERSARRPAIADAIAATDIDAAIYDAGRRYRTDRQARRACLAGLIAGLAATNADTRLVFERDETLIRYDQQCLIEAIRANGVGDRLGYDHTSAHVEPLLALPDVIAWCWVRAGIWRRRIKGAVHTVRNV